MLVFGECFNHARSHVVHNLFIMLALVNILPVSIYIFRTMRLSPHSATKPSNYLHYCWQRSKHTVATCLHCHISIYAA